LARRLALLSFALALCFGAPAAAQNFEERKQSVDSKIAELNEKIEAARAREAELSMEIRSVTSKIQALETRVGDVSAQLAALEHDLALHRERLARITELWKLLSQRLTFLRHQHSAAQQRLNLRLIEIYQSEETGTLDVILAASSFTDILDQLDYMRKLGSQDRRIAGEVKRGRDRMTILKERAARTRQKVQAATRVVEARTNQVREVRNQLIATRRGLAGARADKRESLVATREEEKHHASEAAALQAVSAQLAARINAAQAVPAATSLAVSSDSTPSASGLIWPVSGPVVSGFGWRWGRMHEGIDIAAGYGAPVVASAAGVVIYAGWMGGYGNLVIVDHGGGLATAYAHLTSFATGGGPVGQGQTVGYIGCTGHCFGPHLHFEVRVNGAAVDPLGYL
jgi:murein DD-endopeptidase MepM/ murein hydrolase activator NlpD